MGTAGSIVVDLLARTGSFDTSIDRSTKAAEKRMKEMQRTVETAGAAIGVAMAAAGAAVVFAAKQTIDGLDALNDVSDATGASVENISALEDAAVRSGNSFESVTGALVKFNQQLKDTDPENKTSQILKSIGLDADKLRQVDPAEALHQVAKALSQFADDGDKARVVQELFGKSVREVAPLLKDLAEQEQLHATVTTEEAKAAEEFNKQLAQMHKNSVDLARSIAGDLLPQVNALLKGFREGGILGAFLGMGDTSDPGPKLTEINDKLRSMRTQLRDLQALPNGVRSINEAIFGDEADLNRQIAALEKEQKFLKALQASQALGTGGDVPDAQSRRMGDRPGIGAVPLRAKKGPKDKDPDADFKAYMNQLEQQIQKVTELTASEKLLDDIRRGHLTVTADQERQLQLLAGQVDKRKEFNEVLKLSREAAASEGDAVIKANEAYQERLKLLLDQGPAAQLEKQRSDMLLLADAFERGTITATQFTDASTGYLKLVPERVEHFNLQLSQSQELFMAMGDSGTRALEDLALGASSFSDVMKQLLLDLARMIFQLGVAQPLMRGLQAALTGGVTPPNPDAQFSFGNVLSSIGSAIFGGGKAGGGDVLPDRSYLIGENGPERFVPRTAGVIVPNAGAAAGGGWTIVNQTTGRIDSAREQQISPTQRALIIQETRAAVAADMFDRNSRVSQAMRQNLPVRPSRA